jgi:hypothetical protein
MKIFFKKVVELVNYYSHVNCYVLGPTCQYSVLIFCIPTVFDIILLELVRFQNSVSSCSFSCLTLPLPFLYSYSNVKVENSWEVFWPFPTVFILNGGYRSSAFFYRLYACLHARALISIVQVKSVWSKDGEGMAHGSPTWCRSSPYSTLAIIPPRPSLSFMTH